MSAQALSLRKEKKNFLKSRTDSSRDLHKISVQSISNPPHFSLDVIIYKFNFNKHSPYWKGVMYFRGGEKVSRRESFGLVDKNPDYF